MMGLDYIVFFIGSCYTAPDGILGTTWEVWLIMEGSLARKLRVLRAERDLLQAEAAALIGIAPVTLSELERGKRHPYAPTLSKIARGYGVPVEDLMDEEPVLAGKAEAPSRPGLPDDVPALSLVVEGLQERLVAASNREERNSVFTEIGLLFFGTRAVFVADDGSGLRPSVCAALEGESALYVKRFADAFDTLSGMYRSLRSGIRDHVPSEENFPPTVFDQLAELR